MNTKRRPVSYAASLKIESWVEKATFTETRNVTYRITQMPKVLVIDDDRSIHVLAEKSLATIADLFAAETAENGLNMIRQHAFDAVLLDIILPDQNGLALFCEIRKHDHRLLVIFMTSEATCQTAIEAMQLGAFDYLAKPLSVDPLRDLVEKAIDQRKISSVPVAIAAEDDVADDSSELFIGRSPSMLNVFKAIGRPRYRRKYCEFCKTNSLSASAETTNCKPTFAS